MGPQGIAVDKNGNIFVADMESQRIRMFTVGGNIYTVAGSQQPDSNGQYGGAFGGDGGPAAQALLSYPTAVAVDAQGNIYISDYFNSRVRVFTLGGNISTAVGNGGWGYNGDGPATSVIIGPPLGLNFDKDGNLLIADQYNFLVRRYNPTTGMVQTVAGNGLQGMGGDGYSALSAILTNTGLDPNGGICENLDCPRVALDSNSNLYIADTLNNAIRRVDAVTKTITTIAGSSRAASGYQGDNNLATGALLSRPEGLVFDSKGNLFFADALNNVIREINTSNVIHTIAGNQALGCGYTENEDATKGQLCGPIGLTIDRAGNLYVADSGNCLVRRIAAPDANGLRALSTIAGSYVANSCTNPWTNSGNLTNTVNGDNGPATSATLDYPMGVAIDADGSLLIADTFNNAIRRVDLQSGIITTLSTPGNWVSVPTDVAADGHGDIFYTLTNTTFAQWNGTVFAQIGAFGAVHDRHGRGAFQQPVLVMTQRLVRTANKDLSAGCAGRQAFAGLDHFADIDLQMRSGNAAGDFAFITAADPGVAQHMRSGKFMAVRGQADRMDGLYNGGFLDGALLAHRSGLHREIADIAARKRRRRFRRRQYPHWILPRYDC